MQPLSPEFGRIYDGLHRSKLLEKKAELASAEEAVKVLQEKAENDYQTFEYAKTAGFLDAAKPFLSTPFGKGLGYAAGAAIPAVAAGNMVADHATSQGRNRAIEAGLGLAAIGGTMYGIHRATQPKTASDEEQHLKDALLKLASVGYLDEILAAAATDNDSSEEARKLAAEVKCLNREFGCLILRNIVG